MGGPIVWEEGNKKRKKNEELEIKTNNGGKIPKVETGCD